MYLVENADVRRSRKPLNSTQTYQNEFHLDIELNYSSSKWSYPFCSNLKRIWTYNEAVFYIKDVVITPVVEEGKHGTDTGGVTHVNQDVVSFPNKVGYSEGAYFNGTTDYIDTGVAFSPSGDYEISGWFKATATAAYSGIFDANKNIARERTVIVELAEEYNMAVWDLYGLMGGLGSSKTWQRNELMRSDKIHFTQKGYHFKGELFMRILILLVLIFIIRIILYSLSNSLFLFLINFPFHFEIPIHFLKLWPVFKLRTI